MAAVYCINWTECERGWGHRPDGHTLHASQHIADEHRTRFLAGLPDEVPEEYSIPSEPFLVEVSAETAARVEKAGTIWGHVRQQMPRTPTPALPHGSR